MWNAFNNNRVADSADSADSDEKSSSMSRTLFWIVKCLSISSETEVRFQKFCWRVKVEINSVGNWWLGMPIFFFFNRSTPLCKKNNSMAYWTGMDPKIVYFRKVLMFYKALSLFYLPVVSVTGGDNSTTHPLPSINNVNDNHCRLPEIANREMVKLNVCEQVWMIII